MTKADFVTLTAQEKKEWLESAGQTQPYKDVKHSFTSRTLGHKKSGTWSLNYCDGCGLVKSHNSFTQWSIRKGCLSEFHPEYPVQRAKAGNR